MDIKYNQFDGDTLIFKYNVDEYGNPISIKIDKEEKQVSRHGTIQLEFIPDEYYRVIMLNEDKQQMTEVFNRDEIRENTYYIDYNNGVAYLDKSQFGKTKIYNYYKKGIQLVGCSRIYDEHDIMGTGVLMTLQEILDWGKETLKLLSDMGDAVVIIQKLENNITIGEVLHNNLAEDIRVGTPLHTQLDGDIKEASKWKDQLHSDVADGKVLQPLLNKDITEGKVLKGELEAALNEAQYDIDLIESTGNETITVLASEWTYNKDSKMYEKQITHNCASENVHITCKTSDTKDALFLPWRILDKSKILLKSDEAIGCIVNISARYYKPLNLESIDEGEIIAARENKKSLLENMTRKINFENFTGNTIN